VKPPGERRNLYAYNGGLLLGRRVRRMLDLAGWDVRTGRPGSDDWVGVWGMSPTAHRGEAVAAWRDAPILRVEDAFLRSLHSGQSGAPTLGLTLDHSGVHFDPSAPSDLETLLAKHPLNDPALLAAATEAQERLTYWDLGKYAASDKEALVPDGPFVVVADQTRNDASVRASGATDQTFHDMLSAALVEFPDHKVLVKTHPVVRDGQCGGYFEPDRLPERAELYDHPVSPRALLSKADALYTVSSGLGFEAILAGHRPVVFGGPFYAGWGLSDDRFPLPRRKRALSRNQLFAGAMILYPVWYDPFRDALCDVDQVISILSAQARAWRRDQASYVATGMSRWKHAHIRSFFGRDTQFESVPAKAVKRAKSSGRALLAWSSKVEDATALDGCTIIEDGFLRSSGLGAELTVPMSLVEDDAGPHYDPTIPTRLERLIAKSPQLPLAEIKQTEALLKQIRDHSLSKYNLSRTSRPLPIGETFVLVVGQVEDDASVRASGFGAGSNLELLKSCRAASPDTRIVYKPHPDVEADLRTGAIPEKTALAYADHVANNTDPISLVTSSKAVWTISSLLGFEALIRGISVTCAGIPFYAGWGLTTDLGRPISRRTERPSVAQLAHAALIEYPRYLDPVTGHICSADVVAERLSSGAGTTPHPGGRFAAKLSAIRKSMIRG